ncbi:hypothetical protein [Agrobacterium radiobacter]|uniref:hypothetical protein n=1 Tax=Agrobacterium radiobacter TaxID=362 RepID=UPI003CE4845B
MTTKTFSKLTLAERYEREYADRRRVIAETAAYLDTKTLTRAEKAKLTVLRKDGDNGKNKDAIRKFAAPFYRGDARQIIDLLKGEHMFRQEAAKFERAVNKVESGLVDKWASEAYRDLVDLADFHDIELPKLATVRAKPTVDTEPADRTSLAHIFPMPA